MTALSMFPVAQAGALSTGRPGSLRTRFAAWRAERRRRDRLARELALLTDRDLTDLGVGRADIPAIVNGTYRR
jgi:uncharacterized protein YjiS (DUF1127 family)